MSLKVFFCFLLFLSSSLLLSVHSTSAPSCGYVFDGNKPLVELDTQRDTTQLRVNWYGFFGGNAPVTTGTTGTQFVSIPATTGGSTGTTGGVNAPGTYRIAIISEALATKAINQSGADASTSQRCRSSSGLAKNAKPDVMGFEVIQPTGALVASGVTVYTWASNKLNLKTGQKYFVILEVSSGGKNVYTNTQGVTVGTGGNHSSDDDDGFPAYKAGLIAMGIAIFCILLLLLLLLLRFVVRGKKEDKYQTTVHRNENVDKL